MHACMWASPMAQQVKNRPARQETLFLPGESMDKGAWRGTVQRATKSQIQHPHTRTHTHTCMYTENTMVCVAR